MGKVAVGQELVLQRIAVGLSANGHVLIEGMLGIAKTLMTVDSTPHLLPRPFFVLATLNPIESEGAYPLPEA